MPATFLLATTLPVVKESAITSKAIELNDNTVDMLRDYCEDEIERTDSIRGSWNKWLTAIQLMGAPALISFVILSQSLVSAVIILPILLGTGLILSITFWLTTSHTRQPRLYWMMCFLGFGVAIVWIFLIANEVVSVLQAIGMALGASEAILGLTIFALVNAT